MNTNRLYNELAELWRFTDPPADYAAEALVWRQTLHEKLGPGRHHILELGVGGGCLLSHLTADFDATAIDISPAMLENSRRLNPGVQHVVGDMRTVRLAREFQAVIIQDAICYILTEDDLRATFDTARAHLPTGGVFIVSPDYFKETFEGTNMSHEIARMGGKEVAFMAYEHDPDPADTTIEVFVYFFIKESGKVTIEPDRHVQGLFPFETWIALLRQSGFRLERQVPVERDRAKTCLFVARRL